MTIQLSPNLQIDLARVAGQRIAVIGKSGSGKSNTLALFGEQWIAAGLPATFIDPLGQFRDLPQHLPVILASRAKNAHLEVTPANAAALAKLLLEQRISIVLDLSLYTEDESLTILQQYLEALWSQIFAHENPQPYALVIDEAQLYAPQSGITVLSKTIIDVAKRGRHKKLTTVIATQRAASIVKDFLTQATLLIAHRLSFGVDTKLLQEQLPLPVKELNGMMRKLADGEALVIGDAALVGDVDYLQVQIDFANVFSQKENAATDVLPAAPGVIDEALWDMLKALSKPAPVESIMAPDGDSSSEVHRLQMLVDEQRNEIDRLWGMVNRRDEIIQQMKEQHAVQKSAAVAEQTPLFRVVEKPLKPATVPVVALKSGAIRILQTLASVHPTRVTKAQLGTLSSFTPSGGTFNTYFSALKRNGYIDETASGIGVTSAGFEYLGEDLPEEPQTTAERLAMWRGALKAGAARMLDVLVDVYPKSITRAYLADHAGFELSGGTFSTYLGTLKRNGLVEVHGALVRAADALFIGKAEGMWMKTLTIYQPYASLITWGEKEYETRGFAPSRFGLKIGDVIAIHAAKHFGSEEMQACYTEPIKSTLLRHGVDVTTSQSLPKGVVLCIAQLTEVISSRDAVHHIKGLERSFGNYGPGRYGWRLKVMHVFPEPIPARGAQGAWEWELPAENGDEQPATVVNFHHIKPRWNPNNRTFDDPAYVYCGRANGSYNLPQSDWHNPYKGDGAIEEFRQYISGRNDLLTRLDELRGKKLVCWCKPDPCHCDVLVELLRERPALPASQPPALVEKVVGTRVYSRLPVSGVLDDVLTASDDGEPSALPWVMQGLQYTIWMNIHTGKIRALELLSNTRSHKSLLCIENDDDVQAERVGAWVGNRYVIDGWIRWDMITPETRLTWFDHFIAEAESKRSRFQELLERAKTDDDELGAEEYTAAVNYWAWRGNDLRRRAENFKTYKLLPSQTAAATAGRQSDSQQMALFG